MGYTYFGNRSRVLLHYLDKNCKKAQSHNQPELLNGRSIGASLTDSDA